MDENIKNINKQCYIVSLDNGIRREEPVTINVLNSFKDGSNLVQLNDSVIGVYKANSQEPELSHINDEDIIKSDIAELLDVDHEDVKRIVTEENNIGVFTLLNYSKNIETRISATTVLNHIVKYINEGVIAGEEAEYLSRTLQYPAGTPGNGIRDLNQIDDIINLGTYSFIKEIELQKGTALDDNSKDAIKKHYIRMILFDYVIGRKYRGLDYYIISKINEQDKPVWLDAYLAPISVTNGTDKDALVGQDEYVLNNKLVNRESLLQVLFERHYREIKKLTEAMEDAKKLYQDAISRIIYNNTELHKAAILEEEIIGNLEKVAKYQHNIEAKLDKEQKTNKVERTMATQSLNVRVTTKLDLIQKKYPINPKDHPELADKKNILNEEDIKLIVEEERKSSGGFATAAFIISAIALICGIGIGIAYVLIMMGN